MKKLLKKLTEGFNIYPDDHNADPKPETTVSTVEPEPPQVLVPIPITEQIVEITPITSVATEVEELTENLQLVRDAGMNALAKNTSEEIIHIKETEAFQRKRRDLLQLLQREEIPVYDYDKVKTFMDEQVKGKTTYGEFGRTKMRWVWREANRYPHPIPQTTMKLMAHLKSLDQKIQFVITDYEEVNPDPFLGIQLMKPVKDTWGRGYNNHVLVIAHWDEPGFNPIK